MHPLWAELGLLTRSGSFLHVLREAEARAAAGDNILILGETGTGKDLLAQGVHRLSGRPGAFIPFNCAACPVELVESELFGAERGAFTGADRRRAGLVQDAEQGTLFLDEIGDLPARAQGAVLRFIDQGEVRALGSSQVRRVRVGVIAATHHPLVERVESGAFRRDLYFRLAQGVLEIPPLRQRCGDLSLLIAHLWGRLTGGRPVPTWLSRDLFLETLQAHDWPGNVRELEQFLRGVRLDPSRILRPDEVRAMLRISTRASQRQPLTRERILEAIGRAGGRRNQAAAMLGISRGKLYRMLREGGPEPRS